MEETKRETAAKMGGRSTRLLRRLVRPEGLEPPAYWFEVRQAGIHPLRCCPVLKDLGEKNVCRFDLFPPVWLPAWLPSLTQPRGERIDGISATTERRAPSPLK